MFHENIIDFIQPKHLDFYYKFLNFYCCGDYYDRISFQKQLWIYNEMTYYLKMLSNYYLYVELNEHNKYNKQYRFTKILTKFSNEYNNCKIIIILISKHNISKYQLYLKTKYEPSLFNETNYKRLCNYFKIS